MALVSHAFLTLDEVQRWLRVPTPTADELAVIEQITNGVTDRFEQEIGRQIKARSITELLNGTGTSFIQTTHFPVQSVTALKALDIYGNTIYTYDHTAVALFTWGRVMLSGAVGFFEGDANIQITYSGGWATVPDDLKVAGLQMVADWYGSWVNKREPIQSISIGGQTTAFFDDEIPKKVRAVLNRYTLPGASS